MVPGADLRILAGSKSIEVRILDSVLVPARESKIETDDPVVGPRPARPFIVGLGASAGGIEAVSSLLAALPKDLNIIYAVIQHLSPTHRSVLTKLLGRETGMPVLEVESDAKLQPNTVYVTPPNTNIVYRGDCFVLQEEPRAASPRPSINAFFSSLAWELGENAIGVVLSGTGADGAAGVCDIKAAGGVTFAQDPAHAKYPGMPQAAIDTGCIDWILPTEKIALEIGQLVRTGGVSIAASPAKVTSSLKKLLLRVKTKTRIDFSGYKEGTLLRRIERRMAARRAPSIDAYLQIIEKDPEELESLSKDILISVTAFFRDGGLFDALRKVLQLALNEKEAGEEIRVWVPGCATGEEAYSIAILLAEVLGPRLRNHDVKVFATDLDLGALAVARRAVYPESSLAHIPPPMLAAHFQRIGSQFEVSRALRDMVIVARQDLVQDPPFLRLDLISCRNVLIYLQPQLQDHVLSVFHYALRPNGHLFLGKSEGVFQQKALFESVDRHARLFRRCQVDEKMPLPPRGRQFAPRISNSQEVPTPGQRLQEAAMAAFLPPCVLIDNKFEVQHIYGDISAFVTVAAGKPSSNLQQLIRQELRAELIMLVRHVEHRNKLVKGRSRRLRTLEGLRHVVISVHPDRGCFLVAFNIQPIAPASGGKRRRGEPAGEPAEVRAVEQELQSTRERLQTVIEELETSNEEMQALNEEVQAANEELQSTNEELESSNEEMQASNEELMTVNEELQVRSSELAEALNELQKVQDSTGFPLFVCDSELRLLRFNSCAAALFALNDLSLGRTMSTLRLLPGMPDFSPALHRAMSTKETVEETTSSNERRYVLHIAPYETPRSKSGAVVSLFDVTERVAAERSVRESRERLMAIMNHSTAVIYLKDIAGRYGFVNRQFERLYGVNAEKALGLTDEKLFPGHDLGARRDRELEVVRAKQAIEVEETLQRQDELRSFLTVRFPLFDVDGEVTGVCTQSVDVTDRRRAEDELRLANRVFEGAGEGIAVTAADRTIVKVNDAFSRVTGYTFAEAQGKALDMFSSARNGEGFLNRIWDIVERTGIWQGEIWQRRQSGEEFPEWLTLSAVLDADGRLINYVAIFSDITAIKSSQERVEFLATHDELTLLPNRALFVDRVGQAIARAARRSTQSAVLFVDLDNFKVINDSLGHAAGDGVLKQVAEILRRTIRANDTVARFGGDEFVLLMEEITSDEVDALARRIADRLRVPMSIADREIFVTASIGVSLYPTDGDNADLLLKHADVAMYHAKDSGKRCHQFFNEKIRDAADERLCLTNGLQHAIENGELFLLYQPQFDLFDGSLVGIEALVRWKHAEKGLIPTARFIDLAENVGLIHHVGEWVTNAACRQLAEWIGQGIQVPQMSINVSAEQFRRHHLPSAIGRIVAAHRLSARHLTVELTESALMSDPEQCVRQLCDLKALGIKLSIDDFGTGFSSLSFLRRYPLDELKIDRSFVDEVATSGDDRAITQAILAMAEKLGLLVVAEGIESPEQLQVLRQMSCARGQGFLLAPPLTADEMSERLRSGARAHVTN